MVNLILKNCLKSRWFSFPEAGFQRQSLALTAGLPQDRASGKLFRQAFRRSWLAALLALLAAAVIPTSAAAHAILVRSDPADNAILAKAPSEVRLWFSEAISSQFSSAQILDAQGRVVRLHKLRVEPAEKLLLLKLPPLPPGLYSVRWRVLSEADGHFTQGLRGVGVGAKADLSGAAAFQAETQIPALEVLLRWLNYSFLLTLAGSVGVAYWVLGFTRPSPGEAPPLKALRIAAQSRVLALAAACAGLALAAGFGLLLWQMMLLLETLPESASPAGIIWPLLGQTRWGLLWLLRQGILAALLAGLFRLQRGPVQSLTLEKGQGNAAGVKFLTAASLLNHKSLLALTGLLLLALLAVQALTGHAAALTPNTAVAVAVDTLHLLAAGLWLGGLLALLLAGLPLLRRNQHQADGAALARAGWGAFSGLAALSVGLLLATGLYNTGRQAASFDALLATLYGQALLGKISLFLLAGVLGLLNVLLLHPSLAAPLARWLHRPPGWTPLPLCRLPALLLAEAGVGLVVLLVTGLVTAAPPARGAEFEVAAEEIPAMLDQMADDMLVTFSAKPNRPGQNIFTVRAVSTRRPPPAEVMRVILHFTFLDQDLGRTSADALELEPGLYQVGGGNLSLAGAWQVQVVVRRQGLEDSVARFTWLVAPAGPARPVIISKRPLEPTLTAAAGILGLGLMLAAGLWLGRRRWARSWPAPMPELRGVADEAERVAAPGNRL